MLIYWFLSWNGIKKTYQDPVRDHNLGGVSAAKSSLDVQSKVDQFKAFQSNSQQPLMKIFTQSQTKTSFVEKPFSFRPIFSV